ncbi:hypothetical protein S101359_02051 [Bacillus atrophaeus]|nr:hypothetical protein S101359_02051 [Bacillus atrophaeus]
MSCFIMIEQKLKQFSVVTVTDPSINTKEQIHENEYTSKP